MSYIYIYIIHTHKYTPVARRKPQVQEGADRRRGARRGLGGARAAAVRALGGGGLAGRRRGFAGGLAPPKMGDFRGKCGKN